MNTPELIYKLTTYFFNDLIHFSLLIVMIITVRGDMLKGVNAAKNFLTRVKQKYLNNVHKEKAYVKSQEELKVKKPKWLDPLSAGDDDGSN